jgi:deoxyribodipyrimidine photo-lyase
VPELAGLDPARAHAPWLAPPGAPAAGGVTLGETYPEPLVDHGEARARALAAYEAVRAR